jgi:hypothetical protein
VGPSRNEGGPPFGIGSSSADFISNSYTTPIVVTADDHKSRPDRFGTSDDQGHAKGESINDEVENFRPPNPMEAVDAAMEEKDENEADQPC